MTRLLKVPTGAVALLVAAFSAASGVHGQEPPPNLEAIELARSRACVDVLDRLDTLEQQLQPLVARTQRLLAIAEAIAIEDASIVDSLDASDPVEAQVATWFRSDSELAQRQLGDGSPGISQERSTGRDAIKDVVTAAVQAVQAQARSAVDATGTLEAESGRCEGAVFVRPAVLEQCAGKTTRLCDAAADSASDAFQFVDSADALWGMQEFRAWTDPGPLGRTPNGQLGGARTMGYTRVANVSVTVSFGPMLRRREDLTPDELAIFQQIDDSLDIRATHPDIAFAPSLGLQLGLPEALGGESIYAIHFGDPSAPDIVWTGAAGTGAPISDVIALGPQHVRRLLAGEPLTLTAIRQGENGENAGVFALELSAVRQATNVRALLGYMSRQLSVDLARLVPPGQVQPSGTR